MQLKEIKDIYHKELDEIYVKEEVNSFFYLLIEHYLGLERFVLAIQPNLTISKEEEQPLFEALAALKIHRPIQYAIGKTSFMDLDFEVNENVLIPRPETEELVRWIIDDCQAERSRSPIVLDIGTGSGCIATSLGKKIPNAQVFALDVSEKAVEVAKRNAELHKVVITFINGDILEDNNIGEKFDIIVSNPPYVKESEKSAMHKNVLDYEPDLALFVSDENPLVFYEAIAKFSKVHLKKNGYLFLEINQSLAKEIKRLLKDHNFSEIELRKDMFGNDRMVKCSIG